MTRIRITILNKYKQMGDIKHRLRSEINSNLTRAAALHIQKGDLHAYTVDDIYIYKLITQREYEDAIIKGDNEPWKMTEIGINAQYDFNYNK